MALAAPVAPPAPRPTTYFCPPCCTTVALSERTTHKKTEQHSSAVLYQQLLQSLAKLYQSKDNLNTVCEDIFKAIGGNETVFEDLKSRFLFEGEILTTKKKFKKEIKQNDEIEEKFDSHEFEQESLKKEGKNSNENIDKNYLPDSEPIEPKPSIEYTVTALSGAKLKITFENYHGLATFDTNALCRVCRVMLQNTEQHIATKTHVEKVTAPVKNKHCMRPLTTVLSHCMLCNDLVGNSDEVHVSSAAHLTALQRALLQDDVRTPPEDPYTAQLRAEHHIETVTFNDENYSCQVCQIYIPKPALMEHIALDAHKTGMKTFRFTRKKKVAPIAKNAGTFCEYCKVAYHGKKAEKRHRKDKEHKLNEWLAKKDTILHYHFKQSGPDHAICHICNVQVEIVRADEHVNGFDHQNMYTNVLKANYMEKTGEYGVHCLLCKLKLYMIQVINHIKNSSHRKKIQQCFANEIGPEELTLMYRADQDCKNTKVKKILQLNQIYENTKDDTSYSIYECRICYKHFQKHLLVEHILSKNHIRGKRLVPASQSTKDVLKLEGKSSLHLEYENIINMNKQHKAYTPDKVMPEKQEEKDTNHDPELQLALKTNLIESHSDRFNWCNACKKLVTKDLNIMLHIDSKNHKINLVEHDDEDLKFLRKLESNRIEKVLMKYYCNVCDVKFDVGYEDSHIKLESHASNIAKMNRLRQDELLKTGAQYYCSVCSESVPRGLEYVHIANERHKINFEKEEKLKSQGVVKTGINYFCEICKVTVERLFGEAHINSNEHLIISKTKYKKKIESDFTGNVMETEANVADATGQSGLETEVNPFKTTDEGEISRETKTEHSILDEKKTSETRAFPSKISDQPMPQLTLQIPTKKLHYLFDWTHDTWNDVNCLVCKTNLSFYDMMLHRKSKSHKKVYQDILDSNTMFRIRHRCFCECCREIMKVNEEYKHITSENHRFNKTLNTDRMNKSALMELSVRMLNESVAARKRIKTHERYDRTSYAIEESDVEEKDEDDAFWSVHSSTVSFYDVNDENDSDNESSVLNTSFNSAKTCSQDQDETNDDIDLCDIPEDHEIVDYIVLKTQSQELLESPGTFQNIAHLFEKTDNVKELSCLICKTVVPNWSDQIAVHVDGNKHTKKYNSLLQTNDFKEIIDTYSGSIQKYICKSCGMDVGKTNVFEHINSEKHKMYLNAQPSTSGYSQQSSETKTFAETDIITKTEKNFFSHRTLDKNESQMLKKTSLNVDDSNLQEQQSLENNLTPAEADTIKNIKLPSPINAEVAPAETKATKEAAKTEVSVKKNTSGKCLNESHMHVKPAILTHAALADVHNSIGQSAKTKIAPTSPANIKDDQQDPKIHTGNKRCLICNVDVLNNVTSFREHLIQHTEKLKASKINTTNNDSSKTTNKNILSDTGKPKVNQQDNENDIRIAGGSQNKTLIGKVIIPNISAADSILPENHVSVYVKNGHCYLCMMDIPKRISNIKDHVMGRNHRGNLKKLDIIEIIPKNLKITPTIKVENKVTATDVGDRHNDPHIKNEQCILCKTGKLDSAHNVKEHLNGIKHKQRLKSLLLNKSTIVDAKRNEVNQQNEINTPIAERSQSKTSVRKITIPRISTTDAILPENHVNAYVKNGHCYLCDMNIPNNVSNIEDHVMGRNHQGNLEKFDTIEILHLNPPILCMPTDNDSAKIVENIRNTHIEKLVSKQSGNSTDDNNAIKIAHCYLCGVDIPNNIPSIKDHVNSETHTNIVQLLIKSETMIKELNVFVNQHLASESNQNTSGNAETKKKRDVYIPMILGVELKLPENNIDTFVKEGYCYLCDTKVPNNVSSIKDHVEDENHKQNLKSGLSNNSTININYVCPACNISTPKNKVIDHLKNKKHNSNIKKLAKLNYDHLQIVETPNSNSINIGTASSSGSVNTISEINDKEMGISDSGSGKMSNNNVDTLMSTEIVEDDREIGLQSSINETKSNAILTSKSSPTNNPNSTTDCSFNTSDSSVKQNKNTQCHNTVCAEVTSDTNTALENLDIDASNKTSKSGSEPNDCEVIEKKCVKGKTETAITNNKSASAVDNDANAADIFYNCKTEDEETDDSDVEALDDGFYICRVCDMLVVNETDIKSHLDSFRHRINLKEKHFKQGKFPNTKSLCHICNVDVPNNPIAAKKHGESAMHQWRFEKVLLENKIMIRDDKVCYCKVCDLYFSKFTVSSHVKRPDHVKHVT